MSKQHLTAEVFAERIPHVQNSTPLARTPVLRRKSTILSVAACALAIPAFLATTTTPAYGAVAPTAPGGSSASTVPQSLTVSASASTNGSLARETVTYVAPRSRVLTRWHPPTTASRVVKIAQRYLGVPYRFGGESTSGFDCSGFVAYVYAQVGIHLPHSAIEQGRIGHRVSLAAAVPGDVVVMNGGAHVGIYVGNHRMIDAPEPGRRVSVDKIYSSYYFIVRF